LSETIRTRHWIVATALVLAAVLAVTPVVDRQAAEKYDELFQRALITFALARTLNGVISAVQGTELALQPAGVGVTLTPGEILDPVNDLVERFSWIMLCASVSLGIQQVLLDVSAWWAVQALVAVLAVWVLVLVLWLRPGEGNGGQRRLLVRLLLVALFIRFAVPLTLVGNDLVYRLFLEPRYAESTEIVTSAGKDLEGLGDAPAAPAEPPVAGNGDPFIADLLHSLGRALDSAKASMDLREKLDRIQARTTEVIQNLIQLSVVFILQTALLPIGFLWLFLQMAKWLFRPLKP